MQFKRAIEAVKKENRVLYGETNAEIKELANK